MSLVRSFLFVLGMLVVDRFRFGFCFATPSPPHATDTGLTDSFPYPRYANSEKWDSSRNFLLHNK